MKSQFVVFIVAVMTACSFAYAGAEGGSGGVFVKVNGKWVMIDEARATYETSIFGVHDLIAKDCAAQKNCTHTTYGKALAGWLTYLEQLDPVFYNELMSVSEDVEFRIVDNELSFIPDDLPKTEVRYEAMKKAAIFRDTEYGKIIWVSRAVMNLAASFGPGHLTKVQNQGFLLMHELINARLAPVYKKYEYIHGGRLYYQEWLGQSMDAQRISDLGVEIIRAFKEKLTSAEYYFNLLRRGFKVLSSFWVPASSKAGVVAIIQARNLSEKYDVVGATEALDQYLDLSTGRKTLAQIATDKNSFYRLLGNINQVEKRFCNHFVFEPTQEKFIPGIINIEKLDEIITSQRYGEADLLLEFLMTKINKEMPYQWCGSSLADLRKLMNELMAERVQKTFGLVSPVEDSQASQAWVQLARLGFREPEKFEKDIRNAFGILADQEECSKKKLKKVCTRRAQFYAGKWQSGDNFALNTYRIVAEITREGDGKDAFSNENIKLQVYELNQGSETLVGGDLSGLQVKWAKQCNGAVCTTLGYHTDMFSIAPAPGLFVLDPEIYKKLYGKDN